MANFDAQIQALAGTATNSEMNEWMGEGIKEIINVLPPKLKSKCAAMTVLSSATPMDLDGSGEILFVTRRTGSGYHTPCREIAAMYGHLAEDSTDLIYYATATDPAYWIGGASSGAETDAAKLNVFPDPTEGEPANVHHISYATVTASDTAVIANFPDEAEYLVVLYAAVKVLHNKMNEKSSDLPTLTLPVAPAPPLAPNFTTPDIASITISNIGTPPSYTSPNVTGDGATLTAESTALSTGQIGVDAEFLQFDQWFTALGEMIEDDEDIELASAQIEKINTYIQTYNIAMQDSLNTFNKEGAEYQAKLQEALQQAQINAQEAQSEANLKLQKETQDYSSQLSKFQAEVGKYGAELNSSVQNFTTSLQKHTTDYQWLQGQYMQLKADYQQGLQMLVSGGLPQQQERKGR